MAVDKDPKKNGNGAAGEGAPEDKQAAAAAASPLEEVSAAPAKAPVGVQKLSQYERDNLLPFWKDRGIKQCPDCEFAVDPKSGVCQRAGRAHRTIEPYTPIGAQRTVTIPG